MTAVLARELDAPAVRVSPASTVRGRDGRREARMLLEPVEGVPVALSYGQATVALFYSGTRLQARMTRDQVAALVLRGLARIGQDHAGRIHDAHCANGRAWTRGEVSDDEYDRRERRLWPRSEGGESQRSSACLLVHHRLNPVR